MHEDFASSLGPFVSLMEFLKELFEKVYFETNNQQTTKNSVGKEFILRFSVKEKHTKQAKVET